MSKRRTKEFQNSHTKASTWEKTLIDSKENSKILIADVHADWCSNCTAITETFRRIYLENSEKYPISFHTLNSDSILESIKGQETDANYTGIDEDDDTRRDNWIETLEKIRSKSQPHFLFYYAGKLRKLIVGVNTPIIQKTIERIFHEVENGVGEMDPEEGEYEFGGTPELKLEKNMEETDKAFFDNETSSVAPESARQVEQNESPEQQVEGESNEDVAVEDKPSEETQPEGEDKPTEDKPSEDKPSEETSSEDKPTEETSSEDKPSEETPSEDKPSEDKPSEDKPSEDKPSEDKPSDEPTETQPTENQPEQEQSPDA